MFARMFLSFAVATVLAPVHMTGNRLGALHMKCLGAMESSISGAISSSFPIKGGELSRMLFTGS
jgi:hypothetical protein